MTNTSPIRPPRVVVWEVTMRCDQACPVCGSNAGRAIEGELTTAEAVEVARQLRLLGCRRVTLIGGEAYLRDDLEDIVFTLARPGLQLAMQTGGRHLTRERLAGLKASGLGHVGLSIDGTEPVHDLQRGNRGSFAAAVRTMDMAVELGLTVAVNTQLNRLNHLLLREIYEIVRDHGAEAWHIQITAPSGRAVEHPDWLLEPDMIVGITDTAAALRIQARSEGPLVIVAGDDIGYFGPHEEALRSRPDRTATYWQGCGGGRLCMGIAADGTVKPCASLVMPGYVAGNVRTQSIEEIWNSTGVMAFRRGDGADPQDLWGFCASCYYADICGAGCTSTAHALFGRRGNYPYCYHRVMELRKRRIRERLEPTGLPGEPFRIVEVPL